MIAMGRHFFGRWECAALGIFVAASLAAADDGSATARRGLRGAQVAATPAPEPMARALDVAPGKEAQAGAELVGMTAPLPEPGSQPGVASEAKQSADVAAQTVPVPEAEAARTPEHADIVGSAPARPASSLTTCGNRSTCLKVVDDFLAQQPQSFAPRAGLLQTFGPAPPGGGGPCGRLCELYPECAKQNCRFDPYDNAVAAIYLTYRGNLSEAANILIGLRRLMYDDSGRLELLRSAYTEKGLPQEWFIDTGNNAWVAMAFAHYAAASGSSCDAATAHDILHAIVGESSCKGSLGGFTGRAQNSRGGYRATEHNIDMFALARMLGEEEIMEEAAKFVRHMFGIDPEHPDAYATATGGEPRCSDQRTYGTPIAADTQFWNLLAEVDPHGGRKRASLEFALRPSSEGGFITEDDDLLGGGAKLTGVRFTNRGEGAQWENTAAAVMASGYYDAVYSKQPNSTRDMVDQMQASLLYQLGKYGAVLGSVRGGNFLAYHARSPPAAYPGGSHTGMGWTYLRYPHTAATAWTGLMLLEANPFLPPKQPMPAAVGGPWCAPP
mmetsp:Transcript_8493/g.24431  ORF Transcript_8493/g.24431 Transcript_8493/m.24431 type:complete len:555 (-) Transcript_8493:570-2234(-)